MWTTVLALLAIVATIFAIKANIKFDVNEFLRDRRKEKEKSIRTLCPHAVFTEDGQGRPAVRSTFISPSGTQAFRCQICGSVTYDQAYIFEITECWSRNPDELKEKLDKMSAKTKKLRRV